MIENNLLNITPRDPLYLIAAKDVLRRAAANLDGEELAVLAALGPKIVFITADLFFTHYTIPLLREKNPDRVMEAARQALAEHVRSTEYKRIAALTRYDYLYSLAYATYYITYIVKQIASSLTEEERQRLQTDLSPDALVQSLVDAASALGAGQPPSEEGQAQTEEGPSLEERLLEAFKLAARKAEEALETMNAVDRVFFKGRGGGRGGHGAGDQPGQHDLIDLTNKIMNVDMAKEIVSAAKKLIDEMPRFYRIIKARSKHGETAGYRLTHKVEDALPRELALDDDLFFAKLASSGLVARERVASAIGAIYVLLDVSGSMDEGRKTVMSRSVALALYNIAMKRRQRFYLRAFDAKVYELTEDPVDLILHRRSGGGTCIDCALRTAIDDIAERRLSHRANTLVLITDGEDQVDESLAEELKKHGITLIAVMVEGHNDALRLLAEKSNGQYLEVKPTRGGALKIVKAAVRA